MRNVEAKYRCRDLAPVLAAARRLGARDAGVLEQRDVFFPAPRGRLKLRTAGDGSGELIGYERDDVAEPRASEYLIHRTASPEELADVLRLALGERATVCKRRTLLLVESTRIHLDEVEGLGTFVELETVVSGQAQAEAREELDRVAAALGLSPADVEPRAYVDLLEAVP